MSSPPRARLVEKFRSVTQRRFAQIERTLVMISQSGPEVDSSAADELARQFHTLKGEARMMGFDGIAKLAHGLEERLAVALDQGQLSDARFVEHVLSQLDRILGELGGSSDAPAPSEVVANPDGDALVQIADRVTTLALGTAQLSSVFDDLDAIAGEAPEGLGDRIRRVASRAREHARDAESASVELLHCVRDLQLVPLVDGFARYPRAVRDLGRELGKRVQLELDVGAVQIDRDVLERLHDPLLHVLRNAVDHGCESPEQRRAAGKSDVATIRILARRRGSDVVVEIVDDGRGVDGEAVAAAARRRGHPVAAGPIDAADALQLLFAPGMSTRDAVSDVSGRGVGLDVVRERIEALGGAVALRSRPGEGTTVELAVAVSSMLIQALVVRVGPCRCALPLDAIEEIVRDGKDQLVPIGDTVALEYEGDLLPLRDLSQIVDVSPRVDEGHVLIVRRGAERCAIVVDRVVGERQIVLRGKGEFLARSRLVRDIGIATDGETTLVLDLAAVISSGSYPARAGGTAREPDAGPRHVGTRVVVADDSELTRDMLVRALRDRGFDVVEAVNGRDALAKIERHRPAAVFTDLDMPHLDGFGLIERLNLREVADPPKVVVFSTHADPSHIERATRLGAVGYLVKAQFDSGRLDTLLTHLFGASAEGARA